MFHGPSHLFLFAIFESPCFPIPSKKVVADPDDPPISTARLPPSLCMFRN